MIFMNRNAALFSRAMEGHGGSGRLLEVYLSNVVAAVGDFNGVIYYV